MARIKDAAVFVICTDDGPEDILCDVVEIHERPAKNSFFDDERGLGRIGKRNGKRRSFYRPSSYRGETKVKIFLLDRPARPMVPLIQRFQHL